MFHPKELDDGWSKPMSKRKSISGVSWRDNSLLDRRLGVCLIAQQGALNLFSPIAVEILCRTHPMIINRNDM